MNILKALLLTLSLVVFQSSASDSYAKLTEANIVILQNNSIVHEASIILLDGRKASISFLDEKTGETQSKIMVTSNKNL